MQSDSESSSCVPNPADPEDWKRLVDALNPAAMLLRVEARMSPALKQRITAEDIWQETLLCAWRDRERLSWRGFPAFRSWLMEIAENRIRDEVERLAAAKRDGGHLGLPVRSLDRSSRSDGDAPARSKSPSSAAVHAEQALVMRQTLEELPELYREVIRLRLFEEWDRERIASELGLSVTTVKHRIRLGAGLYRELLARVYSSRRPFSDGITEPRRDATR